MYRKQLQIARKIKIKVTFKKILFAIVILLCILIYGFDRGFSATHIKLDFDDTYLNDLGDQLSRPQSKYELRKHRWTVGPFLDEDTKRHKGLCSNRETNCIYV